MSCGPGTQHLGVDKDEHKVRSILEGKAPFFEPQLEPLIQKNLAAGRLSATPSAAEALRNADIALICVGTPSEKNGNLDLGQLRRVVEEIAQCVASRSEPLIVAIRSTVFPGVCEEVVMPVFTGLKAKVSVVSNPEFLREGVAIRDFVEPSLVVVGGKDDAAVAQVASLYASLKVKPSLVSLRTAEMIKYACNAFHALKVSFANEVGALCGKLDIDGREVMSTLCQDERLNISAAYLSPGFAFGGSCLPKDLRALNYRAGRLDLKLPLLASTLPSNEEHLQRAIQAALDCPGAGRDRPGVQREHRRPSREPGGGSARKPDRKRAASPRLGCAYPDGFDLRRQSRFHPAHHPPHQPGAGQFARGDAGLGRTSGDHPEAAPEVMERIRNSGLPGRNLASGTMLAAVASVPTA
jgi:nucleotide sugar dehydrogenase